MKKKRQAPNIKKGSFKSRSSLRSLLVSALAGLLFAGLFSSGALVFATPPTSQYSPGDTLNPSCAVGSTNCSIISPVPYTGATAAVDLGSQNFTTTGTSALGATTTFKYNSTNYATLTAASNGDLTIATTSSTTGGNINISSAVTGDFTFLSNSGTLVLGGTGNSNNENLKFDFETYANKVAVTSGTSVADIDLGALNLATTGTLTLGGSTAGTLVTRVKAGAATESDTNGSLVVDSSNGRLYFRYGSAWHYVAQTAGFQIPDFETIDPISGEEIKEGDIVLGMINQTFEDKALHGVWVKWDSVKADLLAEARGELSKISTLGTAALPETFLDKVKNGLFSLGISAQNGLTTIKDLAVEKFSAKIARFEKLEIVDKATGVIYCTWIENGDWQKARGECGSVEVAMAPAVQIQQQEVQAEKIIEQVKEDLNPQIQSRVETEVQQEVQEQIQEQVKEEVQSQLEELPVNVLPEEPAPEEILPLQSSVEVEENTADTVIPAPIDVIIQETSAAFIDGAQKFTVWAVGSFIPKEVEYFYSAMKESAINTTLLAVNLSADLPKLLEKSTAGIMGPFYDISDFINHKY